MWWTIERGNASSTLPRYRLRMLAAALAWFAAVNAWTILSFWFDKRRATARAYRISEASLLGLALIGGSSGAFAARRLFRHKTRKEPFSTRLMVIAAIQASVAIALIVF